MPAPVAECRLLLEECPPERLPALIRRFAADDREGVRTAVERARKRLAEHRALLRRWDDLARTETALRAGGLLALAGVDEVGYGALAGPLTAAAVVLDPERPILGVDDSKRLTPARREELAALIRERCIACSVAHTEPADVDSLGVWAALRATMRAAVEGLPTRPDHILVDGRGMRICSIPETPVIHGDSTVAAIAAASIVAKVERDALMTSYAPQYPGYAFDENKGYSTRAHIEAIGSLGLTPLHRRSYAPCAEDPPALF